MAYNLLPFRVLVELDQGQTDRGIIVEENLRNFPDLIEYHPSQDPDIPDDPPTVHTHIVFVESGAQEVTQGGNTYYCMHINNVLGYLD